MIAIIGGGVAGMSCALWLKYLGFTPVIIERNPQLGGQLLQLNRINRWVLGAKDKTSVELAQNYAGHIDQEGIAILTSARLSSLSASHVSFEAVIDTPDSQHNLQIRNLVIATGVRIVGHEAFKAIPGCQTVVDNGTISFFPFDHLDKLKTLKHKTVAVIGGGDNAFYTALDAAEAGAKVNLLIRSKPKAGGIVQKAAQPYIEEGLITLCAGVQVTSFSQHGKAVGLVLQGENDENRQIEADHVFVRAGFAANSEFTENFSPLSGIGKEHGYIKTDAAKNTSIPWVFAIGDVANAKHQSVVGAIADGAAAARSISERL